MRALVLASAALLLAVPLAPSAPAPPSSWDVLRSEARQGAPAELTVFTSVGPVHRAVQAADVLALIEAGLGPRTQTVFTSHDFDGFGDTAASQGLGWPGCAAVALNAIAWWGANPLVQDAAPAPSVLQGGAPSKDPCGYGFPAERWQDVSFQLGGWYPDARPYAVCAAAQVLTPEPDAVPQGLAGGTTCINTSDDNWLDACVAGDGALYAWSSWEIEGAGFLGTRGHVVGAAFGDTGQAAPVCE